MTIAQIIVVYLIGCLIARIQIDVYKYDNIYVKYIWFSWFMVFFLFLRKQILTIKRKYKK